MRIVAKGPICGGFPPPEDPVITDHIARAKHPGVRAASSSAWGLLYHVMGKYGYQPGELYFEAGGKPLFLTGGLWFSISHSGGICAAAVSDCPVGVDVERVRPDYRPSLVERSLTPGERQRYDGDFTRLWTRKEAVVKLTGEGITGWPAKVETTDGAYDFFEDAFFFEEAEYRLTAAFSGPGEDVIVWDASEPEA